MTVFIAITGDLSISVFSVHHPVSRAECACLVGSAWRRSQCSRAQFCCKDPWASNTSFFIFIWMLMLWNNKGLSHGCAWQVRCFRALNLIRKMCVSRSYWCLIPTRMWWRLEAANKTLCWWWDRTWVPTPPKTKLQWNICLLWMLPRLATPPDPFPQICHI